MEDPEYQSQRSIPRSDRDEPAYFTRRAPDLSRCIFIPDHNDTPPDVLAFLAQEQR